MKYRGYFFGAVAVTLWGALIVALPMLLLEMHLLHACFIGLNATTFLAYGWDKTAARRGLKRVPESALLLLGALGGTPGAFAGQEVFRHKTRDRRFRRLFFVIAAVQAAVLTVLYWIRF